MIHGQVTVELLVDGPLYNFGNHRNNGNRPEVGWVGCSTGFMDREDEGMFPGIRDFGERYAGIDQMQEHRANHLERPTDQEDADAVLATSSGAVHTENYGSQLGQSQGRQLKSTGADAR